MSNKHGNLIFFEHIYIISFFNALGTFLYFTPLKIYIAYNIIYGIILFFTNKKTTLYLVVFLCFCHVFLSCVFVMCFCHVFLFLVVECVFIKRNVFFQQMNELNTLAAVESQEVALVCGAELVSHVLRGSLLGIIVKVALNTPCFKLSPSRLGNNKVNYIVHLEEDPLLSNIVLVDKDICRSRGFVLLQILVEKRAAIVRVLKPRQIVFSA